jgi:hypothetical protein
MNKAQMSVFSCGCVGSVRGAIRCSRCGKMFCAEHIYSRVDGNNRSITKNAPEYCAECYAIVYPDDFVPATAAYTQANNLRTGRWRSEISF